MPEQLLAIAAITARELGVGIERPRMVSGDTRMGPDEGLTTGSQSVEAGVAPMRRAAALARTLFTAVAARVLQLSDAPEITVGPSSVPAMPRLVPARWRPGRPRRRSAMPWRTRWASGCGACR
jgi:CO/xanthine dehydrogenase Mo-binding subunit